MDHLDDLAASLKSQALYLGFHKVGITSVDQWRLDSGGSDFGQFTPPLVAAEQHLQHWLDRGLQGDLSWMENPKRLDIRQVMPTVKSVVALAINYYTPHTQPSETESSRGKISRYAWGRDYHRILDQKLKQLAGWLQGQSPHAQVRYYADTGPIQDKVWAQRSGLGWIAKNSNLITRDYGSWVFLGVLLTDLEFPPDPPMLTDHCGTCTRCLEACPTQAIVEPFVVDANRCIAYHTIENRSDTLPDAIVPHLQGWVAGCDICQEVCPWNQRFAKPTTIAEFDPYPGNLGPDLKDLAHLTEDQWNQRFPASALRRIKPKMWQRNAQAIQRTRGESGGYTSKTDTQERRNSSPMVTTQLSAQDLFRSAYENRYTWDKGFPGYTADVTYQVGDQTFEGTVQVSADLKASITGINDEKAQKAIQGQLFEIAIHRIRRTFEETHGQNTFRYGKTLEDGSIEILMGGKSEGDRYELRNNEVSMVHRHIHGVVVTIHTVSSHDTGEGYLSHRYDSVYHDPKTGEQKGGRNEFEDEYEKVGSYFLLNRRWIRTEGEADQEFLFSNFQLLA